MGTSSGISSATNFARRVCRLHNLSPPIDIYALTRSRAEIEEIPFPPNFEADGATVYLKVPGKTTKVFINKGKNQRRRRFSLAHELGHIIIPWHTGNIVDIAGFDDSGDATYRRFEAEANRFASEILMPHDWMLNLCAISKSPDEMMRQISDTCDVSIHAAFIRLKEYLSIPYLAVRTDLNENVLSADKSHTYIGARPNIDTQFDRKKFERATNFIYETHASDAKFFFVTPELGVSFDGPADEEDEDWHKIFNEICVDLGFTDERKSQTLKSINGIIGFINNRYKGSDSHKMYAVAKYRIATDDDMAQIANHFKFPSFLRARIKNLRKKRKN